MADDMKSIQNHNENDVILVYNNIDYVYFINEYKDLVMGVEPLNKETVLNLYIAGNRTSSLDPSHAFDEDAYRKHNPDVREAVESGAYISGFHHWLRYGKAEGRHGWKKEQPAVSEQPVVPAPEEFQEPRLMEVSTDAAPQEVENSVDSALLSEASIIRNSGLFDASWYLSTYHELGLTSEEDALLDFASRGWRAMRNPNADFSTRYYLEQNRDVGAADLNPLVHYVAAGDREGRQPSPLLDVAWYREAHGIDADAQTCLAHYRAHKQDRRVSPTPYFDPDFYLDSYPDVAQSDAHPFEHYMNWGHREGRNPSADFQTTFYRVLYLSASPESNPLLHFLEAGKAAGLRTTPGGDILDPAVDKRRFVAPGDAFEEFESHAELAGRERVKAIAFYLPQFHAFPENDEWWGTGFTEWTNIAKAMPRFSGHYQPRIPRDLGFYDLNNDGVLERQVEMARQAGLHGFCFYFYWFNGERLLERPLERLLANPQIDMPFCLLWANENWTRRWDGQEQEVLIRQDYAEEDDPALVDTFLRHFQDSRYIRVDGRPVLIIYRAQIIPNMKERLARWRTMFRERGEMPLILMAQTFNDHDPRVYGFDGAIEFPPHKVAAKVANSVSAFRIYDPLFSGEIRDYNAMVDASLNEPAPSFPLIKTVFPSWDNDARRQGRGAVYHGSTPENYRRWMEGVIAYAKANPFHNERMMFINAWNEWAEGAYLEPDLHFGAAYLNATARAIYGRRQVEGRTKLVLVGHDAHANGAQLNLLGIARILVREFGVQVAIVLLGGGALVDQYRALAETHVCTTLEDMRQTFEKLSAEGHTAAVVNTVVTGVTVPMLKEIGYHVTGLVHELPRIIQERHLQGSASNLARMADALVFACAYVRDRFLELTGAPSGKVVIHPQGLYSAAFYDAEARVRTRRQLGLRDETRLVVNIGYADLRKGFDLFLETVRNAARAGLDMHFAWIGNIDPQTKIWMVGANGENCPPNLTLVGFTDEVASYYSAADAFYLSSREDPFPTVVMEAANTGLPVVAFAGGGGYAELLEDGRFGTLVPPGDTAAALDALAAVPTDGRQERADANAAYCGAHFSHRDYAFELLRMGQPSLKKVSVVVPSYNYARYMGERLESILSQTYPVYEVLVLDDASPDDSVVVARNVAAANHRDITVEVNERNSGNVFAQWRKGAEMASGELLWIAEADDDADPGFLAALCAKLDPERSAFAFSDSRAIDPEGNETMPSYIPYCEAEVPGRFSADFTLDGWSFARQCLAVKNTVLNVSGVVWSATAFRSALAIVGPDLTTYKVAGDWRLYAEAAALGRRVSYIAKPLNRHRRHPSSVTHDLNKRKHLDEVARMQDFVADRLKVDQGTRKKAAAYRKELIVQFALESEENHPASTA